MSRRDRKVLDLSKDSKGEAEVAGASLVNHAASSDGCLLRECN